MPDDSDDPFGDDFTSDKNDGGYKLQDDSDGESFLSFSSTQVALLITRETT